MNEETAHILQASGMNGDIASFLETIRTKSIREVEQKSVHVDYKKYYKDIPQNIIDRLRVMYRNDILLLGYPDRPL